MRPALVNIEKICAVCKRFVLLGKCWRRLHTDVRQTADQARNRASFLLRSLTTFLLNLTSYWRLSRTGINKVCGVTMVSPGGSSLLDRTFNTSKEKSYLHTFNLGCILRVYFNAFRVFLCYDFALEHSDQIDDWLESRQHFNTLFS